MQNEYNDILKFLLEERGFDGNAYKKTMLFRRINNRVIQTNCESIKEYVNFLKSDKLEIDCLLSNFMINVSHFFRNPMLFDYLEKVYIPDLINKKVEANDRSLRIWSAGCACGEEAYSVAILLYEYLEKENVDIRIEFFATDYDMAILDKARKGIYSIESLLEVKNRHMLKFFTKRGDVFEISENIKSMVHFSKHNLLEKNNYVPSESIFGGFDLILCRNVLIYFNEAYQELILKRLIKALNKNSVLVLGESEMPSRSFNLSIKKENEFCNIFLKVESKFGR